MKKVLLAGTAVLGLALVSTPAAANINMDLGGHFRGYAVYNNDDVPGSQIRSFDFRRDTEIHFTGEATSDNGLTVGVHYEAFVGGDIVTDEAYVYFAGNWGRVNFGSEDGAAYLLQVAAPSADSNVDGLRTTVQSISATGLNVGAGGGTVAGAAGTAATLVGATGYTGLLTDQFSSATGGTGAIALSYDHADFRDTERLTYLTPKFSGFQAGISYAPEAGQRGVGNALTAATAKNTPNDFKNLWEVGARWDGEFEGFGISAGAGYSSASAQGPNGGAAAAGAIADDLTTWNAGLNVAFQGFSVGGSYIRSKTEIGAGLLPTVPSEELKTRVWVIGAAWDNGPYHLGVSYLDHKTTQVNDGLEADRWTFGGAYTYGPGMSFRGAVAFGDVTDIAAGVGAKEDFTQITVGTDIQF